MARNGIGLGEALTRGLRRKCPCCGQASAFRGYVKVVDVCAKCQTPLGLYPCDDGPAYVTMLLVGHLVIAPLFLLHIVYLYPVHILAPVTIAAMTALTLFLLPFVKGFYLGLVWYLGLKSSR